MAVYWTGERDKINVCAKIHMRFGNLDRDLQEASGNRKLEMSEIRIYVLYY